MRSLLLLNILFLIGQPIFSQSSYNFNSTVGLSSIMEAKPSVVDSVLRSKGFERSEVQGLTFTYKKNQEQVYYSTSPKLLCLSSTDKNFYFNINSQVIENEAEYIGEKDSILINGKFVLANAYILQGNVWSFATENDIDKKQRYYIQVKVHTVQETKPFVDVNPNKANESSVLDLKKNKSQENEIIENNSNDSTVGYIPKKRSLLFGIGLYRFGWAEYDPVYDPTTIKFYETLAAYNFQFKMANHEKYRPIGGISTVGYTNLSYTLFTGMQQPLGSANILYLNKHYFNFGLGQEFRLNKNALFFELESSFNWNKGRFSKTDETASITSLGLKFGEYYQRYFTYANNTKSIVVRTGFEQFLVTKGGYIGQWVILLGF